MPLTEFGPEGEDVLLKAGRKKSSVYNALRNIREQEREYMAPALEAQSEQRRTRPTYSRGIKTPTMPKDISLEDYEEGKLSPTDYRQINARLSGRDPRITEALTVASALELPSITRTLIGGDNRVANYLRRFAEDTNYGFVPGEYGENAGLKSYLTEPSTTDPVMAAATVLPIRGAGALSRALRAGVRARPRTAAVAGGVGLAGAMQAAQPEQAEAASLSLFAKILEESGPRAARAYARKQAKAITARHRERVFMREEGRPRGADDPKGPGWWKPYERVGGGDRVSTDQVYDSLLDWYRAAQRGDETAARLMNEPIENYDALHWGHRTPLIKGGLASEGRFISGEANLAAGARQQRKHIEDTAKALGITYNEAKALLPYR